MGQLSDTSKLLGEVISLGVEVKGLGDLLVAIDARMVTMRQLMVNIIDADDAAEAARTKATTANEDLPRPVDEGP